jgi:hypothetical protein
MKRLIPILLFAVLLFSCDVSSPEEADKAEILDILDSIKDSFNQLDLTGIMQHYHPDFLHNTDSYIFEEIVWEERLAQYYLIAFSEITIDLQGDFATANFKMTFYDDEGGSVVSQEPDDNGDVSYYYREFGSWKICGNEFSAE